MSICRLNSLPTIYYTLCATAIQCYLLYLASVRYNLYREIRWPNLSGGGGAANRDSPKIALSLYAALCLACAPLLVVFALTGLFKTGNIAGDNAKLGATVIEKRARTPLQPRKRRNCLLRIVRSFWRHVSPIAASAHVAAALCQLVAQQLMIAQLYRFGFINSGDALNTELDFAYQRSRQLATNLPMGDTRLQGFRITSEELAGSPLAPNLLPILMHARLFGVPLEFINLVVALLFYCCSYAAAFWALSKAFSALFTFYLLIQATNVVYSYISFAILLRVYEAAALNARAAGLGQYLASTSSLLVYQPLVLLAIFTLTILCMHLTSIVLYAYGYGKYTQELNRPTTSGGRSPMPPMSAALLDEYDGGAAARRATAISDGDGGGGGGGGGCCEGYAPHLSAILLLLLIVTAKAPTLYALLLLHQNEPQPLFLSCVLVDVVYLFTWLAYWFVLTIKRDWSFRLPTAPYVYKPNLTGGVNPPAPANLFDTYRRSENDAKSATLYQPGSYASIRRPMRPAGLVFAAGTENSDYATAYGGGGLTTALKTTPIKQSERALVNFLPSSALITSTTIAKNADDNGGGDGDDDDEQLLPAPPPATRPIINSINYEQRPIYYGIQQENSRSLTVSQPFDSSGQQMSTLLTPSSHVSAAATNLSDHKIAAAANISDLLSAANVAENTQYASSIV